MSSHKVVKYPSDVPAFSQVREELLALHDLIIDGKGNSEKANKIRNASDEAWFELEEEQQDIINGLSSDLLDMQKVVEEPKMEVVPPAPQGVFEAFALMHDGKAIEALDLLRKNKQFKPFSRICYFRGRCWEALREPRTALVFFRHAHRLAPYNEEYEAAELGALADANLKDGRDSVQWILNNTRESSPIVVMRACEIAFQDAQRSVDQDTARAVYEKLIHALHDALGNLQGRGELWKPRPMSEHQPIYSALFSLVATCCRNVDNVDAAFHYYTIAVGLDPFNSVLLTARGASIYGQSKSSQDYAAGDFQRAISLGIELVLPYFFLAHYLLQRGQFDTCIRIVDDANAKVGSERMKSEMLEFRAIAMAALGVRKDMVLKAFRVAQETDPSNERVVSNMAAYQEALEEHSGKENIIAEVRRQLAKGKLSAGIDALQIARYLPQPPTLRDVLDTMAA